MKRLASLLLLATVMAADCPGSDDPTGPTSIAGTWTLHTVGGSSLPAQYQDGDLTYNVTAGHVVINANGTFSYSETTTQDGVDAVSGTWVAASAANTDTFTPNDIPGEGEQGYGTGVFAGNVMTLTISNGGPVRTYQRN